jgi:hypothetical protein
MMMMMMMIIIIIIGPTSVRNSLLPYVTKYKVAYCGLLTEIGFHVILLTMNCFRYVPVTNWQSGFS